MTCQPLGWSETCPSPIAHAHSRVHLIHACNEEQKNGKFSSREKEEKKEKPKDKGGEARKSQDNERENHKVYH